MQPDAAAFYFSRPAGQFTLKSQRGRRWPMQPHSNFFEELECSRPRRHTTTPPDRYDRPTWALGPSPIGPHKMGGNAILTLQAPKQVLKNLNAGYLRVVFDPPAGTLAFYFEGPLRVLFRAQSLAASASRGRASFRVGARGPRAARTSGCHRNHQR